MSKQKNADILNDLIIKMDENIEKDNIVYNPPLYYDMVEKYGISQKLQNFIKDNETIESNGSVLYTKFSKSIGIICDEFMYNSVKDIADFTYIPFSDSPIIYDNLDFLLIVSSWRGIDDTWEYVANPEGSKRTALLNLIKEYNKREIPTVFYSKEDPVNYEKYLSIAKECKFIFTSALEMIETYKEDTGNKSVDYLDFGINPHYHNPLGKNLKDEKLSNHVIFAGSWMQKYPERNEEAIQIFDGVKKSDFELSIVDRNFNRKLKSYQYPPQYINYVSKTIEHEKLMKLHKISKWGINLNSVKYSETMFANRIYELQAMGNLIISNYSVGVNNKFPNIFIVNDRHDVERILNGHNNYQHKEYIAKSIQEVMLNHTTYHRINKILNVISKTEKVICPKILVIGYGEHSYQSFCNQMYENKHFVSSKMFENNKEYYLNEYQFISYFDSSILYEEYFLNNLISAFAYVDVDVIHMDEEIYNFCEYNQSKKFYSLYSSKSYNKEKKEAFNIPLTEIFEENANTDKNEKLLSVIIPIHNNGKYLEDKCIRSLQRSTIFKNMELILIDDGSTEENTLKIIERIKRRNSNVKFHRFDNSSGSASRPRNKGIKMVETQYLTFLDPDNEASGNGYSKLLKELKDDKDLDMVVGNIIKEDQYRKTPLNYTYYLSKYNGSLIVDNPRSFLIKAGLRAHSIQALIVKTSIIKDNNLKMVEGAAGQDTMFFQEIVLNSSKFKAIRDYIHMYYAAVSGSVTNNLKSSFYEKYFKLELERKKFLTEYNLYDVYMNNRFNFYFKNWYIKKLERVDSSEKEKAVKILWEIFNLYKEDYNGKDDDLNNDLNKLFNYKIINSQKNQENPYES